MDTCLIYDGTSGDGLHGYTDSSLGDQAVEQLAILTVSGLG
jgi:hypothetical protein